ncbi:YfhO family protein [Niallia sp. 03133]|uniref:YfhO family protein n=1 Tax=Niallia sp. 03133 TaxID=3458060 RepID=UPI00404424F7
MIRVDKQTSHKELLNQEKEAAKGKKKFLVVLLISSFLVAFLSHLFFLSEWFNGRYMAGVGDGLSQMIPFKQLLYKEYTEGNFFYSNEFGLGGGIYSQLGYYFSTAIVFLITAAITFFLESIHLIDKPDLFYWANIILVVSIIRMTFIISFTAIFFRYIKFRATPAFIGASLYGTSVIYFRHAAYWDFFADAMLWLPLLLVGIEKIIREKKAGWFIVAIAVNLVNNFYFSYINLLLAGLYIIFRWLFPLKEKETGKMQQVKIYACSGVAAFGISSVSFIPAVSGYLHNYRPPYEGDIRIYAFTDNPLWSGKIVSLPIFAVLCLFLFSFYKDRLFRLFACMTILLFFMHFSPLVASAFNGFSAPQYRWEYFLSLTAGGVAAAGLQNMHKVKSWEVALSIGGAVALYIVIFLNDAGASVASVLESYEVYPTLGVAFLFVCYSWKKNKKIFAGLTIALFISCVYIANQYQKEKLSDKGLMKEASKNFMQSDAYNGKDQLELVKKIQSQEKDPFARIDWMIDMRNNTPIVQNFKGFSIYSSILNKQLLFFYLFDLEIDMGRESVSRYGTLGDRANLYSLLNGTYYIAEKGYKSIPYGFEKVLTSGKYVAYKNTNSLPFFRTTDTVYLENELANASPVAKERAMLEGIVLKEGAGGEENIPETENRIGEATIKDAGASYHGNILAVTADEGGVDLRLDDPNSAVKDYYLSFYLKSLKDKKDDEYSLKVNDYVTTRKSNHSIYKTNVNKVNIRVPKANRISIRVPKGTYKLTDFALYEEDYHVLESIKQETDKKPNVPIAFSGNKITISYNNQTNQEYMILPVPFEKGWNASINGKKQEVLQANYAFTGMKLQKGINEIELVYEPPYFRWSLFITISSLIIVLFVFRRRKAVAVSARLPHSM